MSGRVLVWLGQSRAAPGALPVSARGAVLFLLLLKDDFKCGHLLPLTPACSEQGK